MIKGVLLDLAGVIYDGEDAVPGATEAVVRLHEAGLLVCFVSNTTRSNKQAVLDRLARLGFSVTSDELFTPAQAARNLASQARAIATSSGTPRSNSGIPRPGRQSREGDRCWRRGRRIRLRSAECGISRAGRGSRIARSRSQSDVQGFRRKTQP
ncbi:hypothetical protein [Ensifer canadensis]|uniref:hypothetical protein n=1 Tax=Ensifer canadensis TaxID=555315 RepID=UPI00307EB486